MPQPSSKPSSSASTKPPSSRPTHFLALPLVTPQSRPQLLASLTDLRAEVEELDLPTSAIRPVDTLHLTLGVLDLSEEEKVDEAKAWLEGLDLRAMMSGETPGGEDMVEERKGEEACQDPERVLEMSLTGLHPMHAVHATSVLYALPSPFPTSVDLSAVADAIRASAIAAGLLRDESSFKPHVTLFNTVYVSKGEKKKRGWKGSGRIDCVELVEGFRGKLWAEGVKVERVALCEMGAVKAGMEDGMTAARYTEVAVAKLGVGNEIGGRGIR